MGGAASAAGVSPEWGTEGFHVLQTQQGSPGYDAGLEPYFDFIVAIDDKRLDKDDDTLRTVLREKLNETVQLYVYSTKYKRIRSVTVVPSDGWGGPGLLGVSIRFCSFAEAHEAVWHVTEVLPGSPAQAAGLISNSDYIIGSDATMNGSNVHDDLLALLEMSDRRPIKLYVYNATTDSTREVTLVPDSSWPGEGSIGCQICSGYLHQIPIPTGDRVRPDIPEIQQGTPTSSQQGHTSNVKFNAVFADMQQDNNMQPAVAEPVVQSNNGQMSNLNNAFNMPSQSVPIFHPDQDLTKQQVKSESNASVTNQPQSTQITGLNYVHTTEVGPEPPYATVPSEFQTTTATLNTPFYQIPQPILSSQAPQTSSAVQPPSFLQSRTTPAVPGSSSQYDYQKPYPAMWMPPQPAILQPTLQPMAEPTSQPLTQAQPTPHLLTNPTLQTQPTPQPLAHPNVQMPPILQPAMITSNSFQPPVMPTSTQQKFPMTQPSEAYPAWMTVSNPPNLRQP